jgi:hypothetical protein
MNRLREYLESLSCRERTDLADSVFLVAGLCAVAVLYVLEVAP